MEPNPFLYTTVDSVKVRLSGKVKFQQGEKPIAGELPDLLFIQIVRDAETQIEQELRSRYFIPFQRSDGGAFALLPDHTQRAIRMVVDSQAVSFILETDFARSGNTSGDNYDEKRKDALTDQLNKLLGQDKRSASDQYRKRHHFSPPLEGLRLATSNVRDNGTFGQMFNTDGHHGGAEAFAEHQINDPSKTYLRRPGGLA